MRYLQATLEKDLQEKMVFLTGPRQCGKTTIAQKILSHRKGLYLNWDHTIHRKKILKNDWNQEDTLLCFDEIHKYSRWKNLVKGIYDTQKDEHQFLITGSARLDTYKKGQDSLMGRFFSWRLHPLCLSELKHNFQKDDPSVIHDLLNLGGFPEPFLRGEANFAKRWRNERINLVFRQDIMELENIRDINLLEIFYQSLTERASSEIALSNIARDIEIAPKTANNWLNILEKTYVLFSIRPYSKNLSKALLKTPKVYFYDNGEVESDIGAKFENLVATHLLKKIHFLEDSTGDKYELNYLRDKNGHEIDFLIQKNRRPIALIEVKVSDTQRSSSFYYYKERLKIKHCLQLVLNYSKPSETRDEIKIISASEWLSRPLEMDFDK